MPDDDGAGHGEERRQLAQRRHDRDAAVGQRRHEEQIGDGVEHAEDDADVDDERRQRHRLRDEEPGVDERRRTGT